MSKGPRFLFEIEKSFDIFFEKDPHLKAVELYYHYHYYYNHYHNQYHNGLKAIACRS